MPKFKIAARKEYNRDTWYTKWMKGRGGDSLHCRESDTDAVLLSLAAAWHACVMVHGEGGEVDDG